MYVEAGVESGTLAVYVNGNAPDFAISSNRLAFTLTVTNPNLAGPLYVGIAPLPGTTMGEVDAVAAIAGFQPDGNGDQLLFLHGL